MKYVAGIVAAVAAVAAMAAMAAMDAGTATAAAAASAGLGSTWAVNTVAGARYCHDSPGAGDGWALGPGQSGRRTGRGIAVPRLRRGFPLAADLSM